MDPSIVECELKLADGRTLRAYDRMPPGEVRQVLYWHHGSPNVGAPPAPLFARSDLLGIRWLGHDRPGYGGSSRQPGRDVAAVADDARAVADHHGVNRFAVMGSSGGGPHALACAALLSDRVSATVCIAGLAPFRSGGFDPFAGMADPGALRAAEAGRAAREAYAEAAEPGEPPFIPEDWAALNGDWAWLLDVVRPALASGPAPLVDDDVALVADWGFALDAVTPPVLIVHGSEDRMVPVGHARRLAELIPGAETHIARGDGHVSVLRRAAAALDWLMQRNGTAV